MKASLALKKRQIVLDEEINGESIFKCLFFLYKLIDIDKKLGEKQPIEILINSNGGDLSEGFALISLIEIMKNSGYKIITTNIGKACSMAFVIAISGSERRSYKFARYLFHGVSYGYEGFHQEIKEKAQAIEELEQMMIDYVGEHSNISREKMLDVIERKQDWNINPKSMKELKGVDIICEKI